MSKLLTTFVVLTVMVLGVAACSASTPASVPSSDTVGGAAASITAAVEGVQTAIQATLTPLSCQ